MNILNPRETLKETSQKYPFDQRGYSYLSDYAQTIKYLMTKWKENEGKRIDNLYFLELKLDDFIADDLPELYRVKTKNLKSSRNVLNQTERKLMNIRSEFLAMFDNYYKEILT